MTDESLTHSLEPPEDSDHESWVRFFVAYLHVRGDEVDLSQAFGELDKLLYERLGKDTALAVYLDFLKRLGHARNEVMDERELEPFNQEMIHALVKKGLEVMDDDDQEVDDFLDALAEMRDWRVTQEVKRQMIARKLER